MSNILTVTEIKSVEHFKKIVNIFNFPCDTNILNDLILKGKAFTIVVDKKLDQSIAFSYSNFSILKTFCVIINDKEYIYSVKELENFMIKEAYLQYIENKKTSELITLMSDCFI